MTKDKRSEKHELFRRIINSKLALYGYDKKQLATMLHISHASIYNKLKNPDFFTYRELHAIFDNLNFTADEQLQIM